MLKKTNAFTLAEVLITLAIIGVIAALTLPTLITNYQKNQYAISFKKSYTILSQFFKQYLADEGVSDLSQTSLFSSDYNYPKLDTILKKYFRITKLCTGYNLDRACTIRENHLDFETYSPSDEFSSASDIYTADGMAFSFTLQSMDSCKPDYSMPINLKGQCLIVSIDTNGPKSPNIFGRDFFYQLIVAPDGNVYFNGSREVAQYWRYIYTGDTDGWEIYYWANSNTYCGLPGNPSLQNAKGYCEARIRDEGWTMNY